MRARRTGDCVDFGTCIDDETLALLVAGVPDDAARSRVVAHIERCDACRALVTDAIALADETRTIAGRYRLEGELGRGGMGMVFRAHDDVLDRTVAIKLLPGRTAPSDPSRVLALRESRAMARVRHPNVIAVHDAGHDGDEFYVAMEHVDGSNLRQWIEAQPRSIAQIVAMYIEACRGLAAAHAVGVVHRDFKPDNVLVDDEGKPRVADFGLARWHDDDDDEVDEDSTPASDVTVGGRVAGTPAYMPPEQVGGQDVDRRADVFAVCVALWEACYGVRPFPEDSIDARLDAIARGERRGSNARVGAGLRRVLDRGLAYDREDRHASVTALVEALEVERRRPTKRRRIAAAIGGAGIVLASVLVLRDTTAPCRAPVDRLAAAMRPEAMSRLQQTVFAGLDETQAQLAWAALRGEVHGNAAALDQEHVAACEATASGALSTTDAAHLTSCLRIERATLAHRLELGGEGNLDAVLDSATTNAPTWCRDLSQTWAGPDALDVDDATLHAEALLGEAEALQRAGQRDVAATRAAEAAEAAAAAGQPALAARARFQQGAYDPERDDAAATLQAAAQEASALGEHSTAALAWVFAGYSAQTEQGREHLARAREEQSKVGNAAVREHIEVRLSVLAGEIEIASGNIDAGCAEFDHAVAVAREHAPTLVTDVLSLSSLSASYRGDVQLAMTRQREVVRLLDSRNGSRPIRAHALWNLAGMSIEADDLAGARAAIEQAIALERPADDARRKSMARLTLAEVLLRQGEVDAAEATLADLVVTPGSEAGQIDDRADLAGLRVLAALLREDLEAAVALSTDAVDPRAAWIDLGMDGADARVIVAEAQRRSGRAAEARASLEAALTELQGRYPRSPETARIGVALGWVLHELGLHDDAIVRFDAALATTLVGPSRAWGEIGRLSARRARGETIDLAAIAEPEAQLRRYSGAHRHELAVIARLRGP